MKRSSRRKRVWWGIGGLVGFILVCGAGRALADGVFAYKMGLVQQDIRGPEQKAVIVYREGKETLILSVKYEGAVGDFAWVVPVPSRPKVEKGDPKVFEELAWLTAPEVKYLGAEGKGKEIAGGLGGGVEVLERKQVGVYDVAVLAASEEKALADWLKDNGYALPGNPERVLRHYVRKGWFYVAMRIDPKKVEEELVKVLKQVDPRVDSVAKGEQIALEVTGDDIGAGRAYTASRLKQMVEALMPVTRGRAGDYALLSTYDWNVRTYWNEREPVRGAGGTSETGAMEIPEVREAIGKKFDNIRFALEVGWRSRRGGKLTERDMAAAVKEVHPGLNTLREVEEVAWRLAQEDILAGRVYEASRVRKLISALNEEITPTVDPGDPTSHWPVYEQYQKALEGYWKERVPERRDGSGSKAVVIKGSELWNAITGKFQEARSYVEKSLQEGTLHPVSLSFASERPVYPLRMTSLNPGHTKVLLYVIAGKRARAPRFRVRYAGSVKTLRPDLALSKLLEGSWRGVGGGERFLTKLERELTPEQMGDDVTIRFASRNTPYTEVISGAGAEAMKGSEPPPVAFRNKWGTERVLSVAPGEGIKAESGGGSSDPQPRGAATSARRRLVPDAVALPVLGFLVGVLVMLVVTRRRKRNLA